MLEPPVPPSNEEKDSPIEESPNSSAPKYRTYDRPIRFIFQRVVGEKSRPKSTRSEINLAVGTYGLGLATIAVAIIATIQAVATRDAITHADSMSSENIKRMDSQIAISRDAETRELRAYAFLSFDSAQIAANISKDGRATDGIFAGIFLLNNTGKTPAYHVSTYIRHEIRPVRHSEVFDTSATRYIYSSTSPVYPGERGPIIIRDTLSRSDLDKLATKKFRLFIWGWMKYRDAFNFTRISMFRFESGDDFVYGIPYSMRNSKDGNESD